MELTALDKELLDGLQVLTDAEVSRVQAHLAAGLPMQIEYGWDSAWQSETASCFGCVVGVAMSPIDFNRHGDKRATYRLSDIIFPRWAVEHEHSGVKLYETWGTPLGKATLARLAAILDMEWTRRHPLPADPSPIIPTREGVTV